MTYYLHHLGTDDLDGHCEYYVEVVNGVMTRYLIPDQTLFVYDYSPKNDWYPITNVRKFKNGHKVKYEKMSYAEFVINFYL